MIGIASLGSVVCRCGGGGWARDRDDEALGLEDRAIENREARGC